MIAAGRNWETEGAYLITKIMWHGQLKPVLYCLYGTISLLLKSSPWKIGINGREEGGAGRVISDQCNTL